MAVISTLSSALLAEFVPALLVDFDAVLVGGFLDPLPRFVAVFVGDTFDLVEAGDRVPDMAGVVERFLAANNLALVLDLVVWPEDLDLRLVRLLLALAAVVALIWGFIWEVEDA